MHLLQANAYKIVEMMGRAMRIIKQYNNWCIR